ncbi:hypothetical protein DL93DRAFT_2232850 [Clavulina sp. PMI_390]|nr:hypothetical protein DL93DRAFT_2232850 [Clavulina sp. PMI_390]
MDLSPFVNTNESIDSLSSFIDGLRSNHTPVLLCHPPSPTGRSNLASIIQDDVNTIENHLVAVGELIDKLSNLRASLLRKRAACVGALTPIGALPAELLSEVFQLVASTSGSTVKALNDVCHYWRSIVSEKPNLWASPWVLAGEDCSAVTAHRIHSSPLPLHLAVSQALSWPAKLKRSFPDAETRLETLRWSSSADISSFFDSNILDQPRIFSALHTLKLIFPKYCSSCSTHLVGLDKPPFRGALGAAEFPSLRSLEVARLEVHIPPELLSRLENIKLNFEYMRLERFHEILRHSRSLKSLAIWGMAAGFEWDRPDNDLQGTYVLSHLQTLKLPLHPTEFVRLLVKTTSCPVLTILEFEGIVRPTSVFPDYPMFSERIRSFLQHAPKLEELILSKCKVAELGLFTAPLRTHALELQHLTFCASPVEATPSFLPHLAETVQARQAAGARMLELKTDESVVPFAREVLPDVLNISSTEKKS